MEDYFAVDGDMLDSQDQMDEMEVEHEPLISYIDFFARDNEVTDMVDNEVDQSDIAYIDFFAQGNQLNYVTDYVVDQPVEQSYISFIDFFARDDQTNHVDHVTDDQRAEQSNFLYYDFFNIGNQLNPVANVVEQSVWNTDYYALENQQRAGADPVEQSVQNIDCNTPEIQLCAAANVGERSVPYIDYIALANPLNAASNAVEQLVENIDYFAQENHSQNIDYLAPENHQQSAAANVVEQSVQDIDYNAPENQLTTAANVCELELVPEIDYIALANHLNAAAAVFEQSVGNIYHNALGNHILWNIVYYDPENHRLGIAANMAAEHSVQHTDYYALENQPSGAANVAEQSVQEVDYIAVANELRAAANALEQSVQYIDYIDIENQPSEQSEFNFRVMEENGEMGMNDFQDGLVFRLRFVRGQDVGHSDDYSDHDEDAIPEFEQIPDDDPPFDEHPASRSAVRNVVSVIFTQESVERNTVACAVCMDEFNVGEMAKKLPCSHYFHEECIFPWLDLQNTCPVCRYQLPIGDDSDDEREENERASTE